MSSLVKVTRAVVNRTNPLSPNRAHVSGRVWRPRNPLVSLFFSYRINPPLSGGIAVQYSTAYTHHTACADPIHRNHEIRNQTSRESIEHTGATALAAVGTTCPLSAALSAGPLGSGSMGFLISRRLTVSSSRDQRLRTISRPRVIPAVSYPRRWHK